MNLTVSNRHEQKTTNTSVVDQYGRTLSYLRLSVTDLCNLSCTYCNPVQGCGSSFAYKLSWEDLEFLVSTAVNDLGIEALRITGGEPTVRPGLIDWISRVNQQDKLKDIAMTTNGIRLAALAEDLRKAGLRRVNVSLDTFSDQKYSEATRGGSLARCLEGIRVASQVFDRVKVNAVLMKELSFLELESFVEFSDRHGIEVRFIELMPIFEDKKYFHDNYVPIDSVVTELKKLGYTLEAEGDGNASGNKTGYGPATTYRVKGSRARLGFISQMSNTKCLHCNKLRITSDGSLKACLLSPEEIDLSDSILKRDKATIVRHMKREFLQRAERYDLAEALSDPFNRGMQSIGG